MSIGDLFGTRRVIGPAGSLVLRFLDQATALGARLPLQDLFT